MSKPEFITFTGADDHTDIDGMVELSKQYRIEWGILLSRKRQGTGRYPGAETLSRLWNLAGRHLVLSAHLCGEYSRLVMAGDGLALVIPVDLGFCKRVQVNHPAPEISRVSPFAAMWGPRGIIQWRGNAFPKQHQVDILFDRSGGEGKSPEAWPEHPGGYQLVGYAGGINPDNVLSVIEKVGGKGDYWLDMESGVRTDNRFDLEKCRKVCEQVWERPPLSIMASESEHRLGVQAMIDNLDAAERSRMADAAKDLDRIIEEIEAIPGIKEAADRRANPGQEVGNLKRLIRKRHAEGMPVASDVAVHAALLVSNGWPADKAIEESIRTLDDAEREGGY